MAIACLAKGLIFLQGCYLLLILTRQLKLSKEKLILWAFFSLPAYSSFRIFFNFLAIKKDQGNWLYYEKRIQILDSIGDIELAMKTRLQAAQSINCQNSQINFAWIDNLIKTVF